MTRTRTTKGAAPLGTPSVGTCVCKPNPRTKQNVRLCYVGKSQKHRNGWKFSGRCPRPQGVSNEDE